MHELWIIKEPLYISFYLYFDLGLGPELGWDGDIPMAQKSYLKESELEFGHGPVL